MLPVRYGASGRGHRRELGLDVGGEAGILRLEDRLDRVERGLRALDVGLEVDQVGVRVALLLTRDLRRRHLVEQLDRAVRDRTRLEVDVLHQVLQGRDVVVQSLGVRR